MIQVVADTTCSLPQETARALGIPLMPQIIIFGKEAYRDDSEIDTATFFRKLRSSPALPQTSAPPPALYEPVFQKLLEAGDAIVVICPSAELSGTFRSAENASLKFPGAPIHVVDMRTIAGTLGAAVVLARRWAGQGIQIEELLFRLASLQRNQRTYFLVDTLEFLHRGGRIGGARRLLGEMLQVKPILRLEDGRVMPFEQPRTRSKALHRLQEIVLSECPGGEGAFLSVMHAEAAEAASELSSALRAAFGMKEIPIYELPPAIAVHAGPGVLAVGYYTLPVT
jgi:DegV family protein with EDD domain